MGNNDDLFICLIFSSGCWARRYLSRVEIATAERVKELKQSIKKEEWKRIRVLKIIKGKKTWFSDGQLYQNY